MSRIASSLKYRFPALAVRNFRLFLAGQAISVMGTWMQGPVLKWLVFDISRSNAALGMVDFLGSLPMTVFALLAGVIADRYPKRWLVFGSQTALMVIAFGLAGFAVSGRLSLTAIYVFAVLGGLARAVDVPTRQAFVMEVAGRDSYSNAVALHSATFNTARMIAPSVGAVLLAATGAAICFFLNGVSYIAVLVAIIFMRDLQAPPVNRATKGISDLLAGLSYAVKHKQMRSVFTLWAFHSLFGTAYITLLASIAKTVYAVGSKPYGLLLSAQGFGAFVGALLLAATTRTNRPQVWAMGGLTVFCATLAGLAFTTNYYVALCLIAVYGFSMVSFVVSCNILVQLLAKDEFRGRVMGIRTFVFGGLHPLGALIAGYIGQYLGPLAAVKIGAAILVIAGALMARSILATELPPSGESVQTPANPVT